MPASLPLAEAVRRADAAGARALIIVDHEGKPIAIVNETAVMATPEQRRPWIEAGALARTLEPSMVLSADLSGMALIEAVRQAPASEYLLVEPSGADVRRAGHRGPGPGLRPDLTGHRYPDGRDPTTPRAAAGR